jgi:DNA-binding transcriptional MerR regulator
MLRGFTAQEVARLAGFNTVLMLNYLERTATFEREHRGRAHQGKRRLYSFRDLVVLRAINRLLLLGARPKRIEDAMRTFRRIEDLPHDADSLAEFARRSSLFVVTADEVVFCDCEQLVELSRNGQLAFSFMVDNRQVLAPVVEATARYIRAIDAGRPRNRATLSQVLKEVSVA